ncbi:hypothetical protein FSP39_014552 [Pinctada imbricata]|uniref:B box-type domain-containing protein n=1 Tax=Pinctada imbricata TaxID=66713 RepID=A0AA88Y4C1_PINIB|nr:hypothetical protein FSP39_014552 [Pinctada imbricata]
MVFSVTEFLKSPTVGEFESLKKDDFKLIVLGLHLKLDVKSSMRKQEIRNIVAKELLAKEIFSSYDFPVEPVSSETKMSKFEFELEKMKIQLQFEKEEKERQFEREEKERQFEKEEKIRQFEREKEEREKQERMHEKELQFELEKLKLEKSAKENPVPSLVKSEFDAAKNIRLVPKFQEKSVDKYFPHFEKIAANLKWPRDFWPTLLQSVLIGKAAEVYSALSIAESSDYDKVKDTILRAYQLVPEAYRQKFRKYKKFENQTHVEFAREKEDLFDQWFRSKKIPNSFDNLRQIILIEEFKECVHQDLRTHLEDKNVKTVEEAAVLSDTYALTHKKNFVSKTQSSDSAKTSDVPKKNLQESQSSISSQSPSQSGSTSGPRSERSEASPGVGSLPTCNYCKKKGHVIGECLKLKKKKELKSQACASVRNDRKALDSICSDTPEIQDMTNTPVSEWLCEPCRGDGERVKARTQCYECHELLCQPCSNSHLRFKITANHHLIELIQYQQHFKKSISEQTLSKSNEIQTPVNEDELASDFLEHITLTDDTVLYKEETVGQEQENQQNLNRNNPKQHQITKRFDFRVSRPNDQKKVIVMDVLCTEDTILVVDNENKVLKMFDRHGEFQHSSTLKNSTHGITCVRDNVFATCGEDKMVHVWALSDESYQVDHRANGIHFNGVYFCVLHHYDNAITILDKHKKIVRKIVMKQAFGKKFEFGWDIHMDKDTNNVFVPCQHENGVLCLTIEGKALWFSPMSAKLWGITEIQETLCVVDIINNCIHQINKKGEYIRKLIDEDSLDGKPICAYSGQDNNLYISYAAFTESCDKISVYTVI